MRVSELGEFGLINLLRGRLGPAAEGVVRGSGDDTAILKAPEGRDILATCDALVEGVHFLRENATARQIGAKAVAVNLSDVAAMGGDPRWILVSLGMPDDTSVDFVEELCGGMVEMAAAHGASIVGGNMAGSPERVFIDVFLMGVAPEGGSLLRSGARTGDVLLVTGNPGESAAGLALLGAAGAEVENEVRRVLVSRHLEPSPRLDAGRVLAGSGLVTSAMDVSDGVLADLAHICEESECGAVLETGIFPLSAELKAGASVLGKDPVALFLHGGEDYELLFTVPRGKERDVIRLLDREAGIAATVIGKMEADTGLRVLGPDGAPRLERETKGWTHFTPREQPE
ncbi:MAG: thiamine-phosphate kinase [Desulfatibacillaceae bacterium]